MIFFLKIILKFLARATVRKYRPRVIGITGSVGKTTVKDAVAAVLGTTTTVWQTSKNLNNEIGLPLAILGEHQSGYSNPVAWVAIFVRGLWQLLFTNKNYPKVLVLEYGVDHPNDMSYLLSVAKPEMAVFTAVTPTHLEFMGTVAAVAKEKSKIITTLEPRGVAILNADDKLVLTAREKTVARVVTYGFNSGADVRAEAMSYRTNDQGEVLGVQFKLSTRGSSVPVFLNDVVGKPPVYSVLAAVAVGRAFSIPLLKVAEVLQQRTPTAGRLRLVSGINNVTIIDDTYNSSPRALSEALQTLIELSTHGKRWAVLGDMLELGDESKNFHYEGGVMVADLKIDYLVTVGKYAQDILRGAEASGFNKNNLWHFASSSEAGEFIKNKLQAGDVVLIKGSQGVRCEKITKALMREPARAKELLVRQYKPWI